MFTTVQTLGISGIHGYEISVESNLTNGLPAFDIVGLPDASVKEARDRVRAAAKNCGLKFPVSRVTVNLAPADIRKSGTAYDLPVLISILSASDQIPPLPKDAAFIGELSLAGDVRPVPGMLPMAICAGRSEIRSLFVPAENAVEASFAENIDVYPLRHVKELLAHLDGSCPIAPIVTPTFRPQIGHVPDFADVKGQEQVKRALEIAAAGGHNVLLVGPPGSGKSMLAKRLPGILPNMTKNESLESTEIYSVAGLTTARTPILMTRPFRAPHHTISPTAMTGGSSMPRPGEISLAHNGVLFLDELPEFPTDVLETLRQPLEDGVVTISRVAGTVTYPSKFMLVCAMNPCKCGWYGHPSGRCTCSPQSVKKYLSRISGPLLDRIDIFAEVPALKFAELRRRTEAETSEVIRERVNGAREIQLKRFEGSGVENNAGMDVRMIGQYCALDSACEQLMKSAYERLTLTARSYDRILRVARTIADLDGMESITPSHLAEAIQYRTYDFTIS